MIKLPNDLNHGFDPWYKFGVILVKFSDEKYMFEV